MGNTVRCYHDKMKGAFVLRQFTVCVKLVLQIFSIIIVYGEGVHRMFLLADVRKAVGPLLLFAIKNRCKYGKNVLIISGNIVFS